MKTLIFSSERLLLVFMLAASISLHAQQDSCDLQITASWQNISCQDAQDGHIALNITGGTSPYDIQWNTGDSTAIISGLSPGTYSVTVTDSNGCTQSNISITTTNYQESPLPIPDGTGVPLLDTINFSTAPPGAIITDTTPLLSFCINIEHSWMRDLEIKLICPSGQEVILHNFYGQSGGEVFLGEPIEGDPTPIPGTGYTYCWTDEATNGTWIEYANQNNVGTLPPGDYTPFQPLSTLNGCPFNGDWILSIEDLWSIDNGYLFGASMEDPFLDTFITSITLIREFDGPCPNSCPPVPYEDLFCSAWLHPIIADFLETGDCASQPFFINEYDWNDNAVYSVVQAGEEAFYFCDGTYLGSCISTTSGIICDSAITNMINTATLLNIIWDCSMPLPEPGFIIQQLPDYCNDQDHQLSVLLSTPNQGDFTFLWSTGDTSMTIQVVPGMSYSVTVTGPGNCSATDSIFFDPDLPTPLQGTISVEPAQDTFCYAVVTAQYGTPPYCYTWSNGNAGTSNTLIGPGPFSVTICDSSGCTITLTDTCNLSTGLNSSPQEVLGFSLSPNPADEEVQIHIKLKTAQEGKLELLNLNGRLLQSFSTQGEEISLSISLKDLPDGTYLLRFTTQSGSMTKKILKSTY